MGKEKHQQTCKYCGKKYLSQKLDSKYCSYSCSHSSKRDVKRSDEYCESLSKIVKEKFKDPKYKEERVKISIKNLPKDVAGEKNGNFRNWATKESKNFRIQHSSKFKEWRSKILKKCDNKCMSCGTNKGLLDAHHIIPLSETTKPAFEIWNGVILCRKCHGETDSFGGKGHIIKSKWSDQLIIIKFVPLVFQEYETLGNYKDCGNETYFIITDTGNPFYNKLILIHELVEQTLTEAKGIKEQQILRHDLEFEKLLKDGKVDPNSEPGEHKNSPYRQEHLLAEIVEKLMLNHLNRETFSEYNNKLFKIFE